MNKGNVCPVPVEIKCGLNSKRPDSEANVITFDIVDTLEAPDRKLVMCRDPPVGIYTVDGRGAGWGDDAGDIAYFKELGCGKEI